MQLLFAIMHTSNAVSLTRQPPAPPRYLSGSLVRRSVACVISLLLASYVLTRAVASMMTTKSTAETGQLHAVNASAGVLTQRGLPR